MADELEGALIDWINTCCPEADVEEFDDLADGAILADVLQLYAPEADPLNTAAGSAKLLHGCLSSYFGDRISLPRLAGNMHNGAFCKPKLLRSLAEAVLLAAVEGPQKEEAVQAIMNLEEPRQMALGDALQRLMAQAPPEAQDTESSPTPPTPEATPRELPEYKSAADFLQDEIQEMKMQRKAEMVAIEGLQSSEKALVGQLKTILRDFAQEEEQAAEAGLLLQKWQRSYGDEMRQRKLESQALQQELQRLAETAKELPQQQLRLQDQLTQELEAKKEMQDSMAHLEVELREASESEQDDLSTVKAEMMASQMNQNVMDRKLRRGEAEEKEQMQLAKSLWENLQVTEAALTSQESVLRQAKRVAEKEEESEADVLGLLEFRECEMRQLELALGEEGARGTTDVSELRVMLRELGQVARRNSHAQGELRQEQQRSKDLAHRLQQLEDELQDFQRSEALSQAEARAHQEEELKVSTASREQRSELQWEVSHAKLEKSQMEGRRGEEVEALQARSSSLRSEVLAKQRQEKAEAEQVVEMNSLEVASRLKRQEVEEAWQQELQVYRLESREEQQKEEEQQRTLQHLQAQRLHEQQQKEESLQHLEKKREEVLQHQRLMQQHRCALDELRATRLEAMSATPAATPAMPAMPAPAMPAPATSPVAAPAAKKVRSKPPAPPENAEDKAQDEEKAMLRSLRQQLAEQEGQLRQREAAQAERRRAMRLETQLISDSIRELGIRCQMLVGKHRALLDDRKRLESEA